MSIDHAGRYVAFASDHDGLLYPSDNNGYADVFVHDLQTQGTQMLTQHTGD